MSSEKVPGIPSKFFLGEEGTKWPSEYYEAIVHAGLLILVNDKYSKNETAHDIITNLTENDGIEYDTVRSSAEFYASILWEFSKCPLKTEDLQQIGWTENLARTFIEIVEEYKWMIVAFEEDFILNPNYYAFTWRLDVEVARRNARNLFDPRYMVRLDLLSSIQSPFQILDQNQDQELDQNDQNISHVKLHHTESLILIENNGNGSDYVNLRNHVGNDNIKKDENENGNEFSGNDGEFGHQNTVGFKSDVVQSFHSYHLQSDYANMKKMEEEIKMALNSLNVINSQNRVDNNA